MSGFELAGVILAAFPLVISGLEHWREVATIWGFYRRISKEYRKSHSDLLYHEILYKRNLEKLLSPLVEEPNRADKVARLISDPSSQEWKDRTIQERLEMRLKDSYSLYMVIMSELKEAMEAFGKELSLGDQNIQRKLSSLQPKHQQLPISPHPSEVPGRMASAKAKWDYEKFRLRYSFNEDVRTKLVGQLNECNQRLRELLNTDDTLSTPESTVSADRTYEKTLEMAFKRSRKRSRLLFLALQRSWRCACQANHYVHLRLEHRTQLETPFEVILSSNLSSSDLPLSWSWKELRCGMLDCSTSEHATGSGSDGQSPNTLTLASSRAKTRAKSKAVTFSVPASPRSQFRSLTLEQDIKLCQTLGAGNCADCIGVLTEDDESYHLHQSKKRKKPDTSGEITLDKVIDDCTLKRSHRYLVALLLASSVAQLQETPWLTTELRKEHVFFHPCEHNDGTFPYNEPFICKGFSEPGPSMTVTDGDVCNFYSLGILLLELCFAQRLEGHPYRTKYPPETGKTKQAFDLVAAMEWKHDVRDEGGHDYASAVKWCFDTRRDQTQAWRSEIIQNVIRPLEACQEQFKAAACV